MLGVAAFAGALSAAPALAQADSCRASAARSGTPPTVTSEPAVANPEGSPCRTDARAPADAAPVGPLTVSEPSAQTRRGNGVLAATASVKSSQLVLGTSAISTGVVTASQVVSCTNGTSTSSGSSRVEALTIAGNPVDIVADQPFDQTIGGVRVRANQFDGTTRRALILDAGGSQIVLGEAGASGDACATLSDDDDNPGGQICPDGATYDIARNVCVIYEPSEPGGVIIVGATYQGPSGGTVISLSDARLMASRGDLPTSRCLRGSGPRYVVLGTNRSDRITGTNRRDRILALGGNDHVDGGRNDDCLDGNRGGDRVAGGLGDDRLFGQGGRDKLTGGLGNDRLYGGAAADSLNTGFGRDYADAGSGNDRVNAASAGRPAKRLLGGKGRDRVWVNRNETRRYRGFEITRTFR
jgi:Ca2+-binding RTX toxin-like protein